LDKAPERGLGKFSGDKALSDGTEFCSTGDKLVGESCSIEVGAKPSCTTGNASLIGVRLFVVSAMIRNECKATIIVMEEAPEGRK